MKDLIGRKKLYVSNADVQTVYVPQYENLTINHIMEFVATQPGVVPYLPDEVDLPKIPKQWIVNVCAAVIGQPFKAWVKHQVEARNALMAGKKEVMIAIDPQMAAKFSASTHVSRM